LLLVVELLFVLAAFKGVRVRALVQVVEFHQLLVLDVLLYLLEGGPFGVVDGEHFSHNLLKLFADVRV
jgi:hypothetical protein